jgi:hypothetical protein
MVPAMRKVKCCLYLLLVCILINAQSVTSLERTYQRLDQEIRLLESRVDSLQRVLEVKADRIDRAKSEKKSESQIKQLMSEAVVVSSQIEADQRKIKNVNEQLAGIEQDLIKRYIVIIDSLKEIKYAASGEEIEWQILDFTYRKFFISPGASVLSFNPQRMLVITREVDDPALVNEYITEAIGEIDSQLIVVSSLHEEINAVYRLRQQAGDFLDEIEMDQDFRNYSFDDSKSALRQSGVLDVGVAQEYLNTRQTASNTLLYNQLTRIIHNPSKSYPINPDTRHMTLKEYKGMLEDLLNYLHTYRNALTEKMHQMQ